MKIEETIIFAAQYRSQQFISEMTGIPQSTISYVLRGIRKIPKKYTDSTLKYYKDETYTQINKRGGSKEMSIEYAGQDIKKVREVIATYEDKTMWTAYNMIMKDLRLQGITPTVDRIDEMMNVYIGIARKSYQKSPFHYEYIKEYW